MISFRKVMILLAFVGTPVTVAEVARVSPAVSLEGHGVSQPAPCSLRALAGRSLWVGPSALPGPALLGEKPVQSRLTSGEQHPALLWRAGRSGWSGSGSVPTSQLLSRGPPLDSSAPAHGSTLPWLWAAFCHAVPQDTVSGGCGMGSFLNFLVQGPRLALPRPGAVGPALCVAETDHRWKQRDSENYSFRVLFV